MQVQNSDHLKVTPAWPGNIRIILGVILVLLSLLNLFPAPAFLLWLAAILISEYAVFWILFSLLLLVSGLGLKRHRQPGTFICLTAMLLFSIPLIEAMIAASDFPKAFTYQFPDTTAGQRQRSPVNFARLFSLSGPAGFPFQTYEYSRPSGQSLSLDFYSQSGASPRPCVLVIHGGSWSGGNSQQLPGLNTVLAEKGYAVASMNYRLSPAVQSPAQVEDVSQALLWLSKHAAQLHIDTTNIVLLGRSAGGQIALQAAYSLHDNNIRGVIDFYGPADLVWGSQHPANPLVINSDKILVDYLGGSYEQVPASYHKGSPLETVSLSSPPTLILHGGNDPLVAFEHSRRLNYKLHQLGVRHYLLALPWATHGFDFNLNGPGGQLSTYAIESFLNSVMHPPVK